MTRIELDEKQLRMLRSALTYVFNEIEDDIEFEKAIGSTRWEVDDFMRNLSTNEE